jgi:hypothetical protein
VLRDGRTHSIVIHLGSRPADPQVP